MQEPKCVDCSVNRDAWQAIQDTFITFKQSQDM